MLHPRVNKKESMVPPDAKDREEHLSLFSDRAESTSALGEWIGKEAVGGEVLALIGPLGAGKTRFVQGLAKGLEVAERYITSPTFILMQCYEGRLPLYHIDLYRMEKEGEIEALGLEEFLEGEGVAAVEWADKGLDILPPTRLTITFRYAGEDQRELHLHAMGTHYTEWLRKIRETHRWKILDEKK
jgi:tRNA threonylcarbamoyladenosine biosynthesis protein TsaE